MLRLKELTIEDRECFESFLWECDLQGAERAFTNLYIWKEDYKLKYTIEEDVLYMVSYNEDEPFAFFPMKHSGDITKEELQKLLEYMKTEGLNLRMDRVTSKEKEIIEQFNCDICEVMEDRDNFDYVYSKESLSTLRGKKYHSKRNHINKFKENNEYEVEVLTKENIQGAYDITDKWFDDRGEITPEKKAIYNMLDSFDELSYVGAIVKVNGRYAAFTTGELLNSNTVVVHIEKADPTVQGLYNIVNREFCRMFFEDAEFVNREQDLGVEGIRKAKKSYNPVKMIDKYIVKINV